jgi:hypothetical protein
MTTAPLPDIDEMRMLSYDQIRYVAGYPEGYVKEYAIAYAQASLLAKEAECEALREDAARYRWLVQCKRVPWGAFLVDAHEVGIDAAIDAADQGGAS